MKLSSRHQNTKQENNWIAKFLILPFMSHFLYRFSFNASSKITFSLHLEMQCVCYLSSAIRNLFHFVAFLFSFSIKCSRKSLCVHGSIDLTCCSEDGLKPVLDV